MLKVRCFQAMDCAMTIQCGETAIIQEESLLLDKTLPTTDSRKKCKTALVERRRKQKKIALFADFQNYRFHGQETTAAKLLLSRLLLTADLEPLLLFREATPAQTIRKHALIVGFQTPFRLLLEATTRRFVLRYHQLLLRCRHPFGRRKREPSLLARLLRSPPVESSLRSLPSPPTPPSFLLLLFLKEESSPALLRRRFLRK